MFKKTDVLTVIIFVLSIFLVSGMDGVFSQANPDAAEIKKISEITGLSISQIGKYGLTADQVLQLYSAAAVSGSSFDVVFENSEKGTKLASFYKKYSVSAFAQSQVTLKYNKLKSQMGGRKEEEKQQYDGIDKRAVAEVLSKKTGISSGAILDFGFGSGLPLDDIITCCAIASKLGNSLSGIVEKRKQGGDIPSVYASLSIMIPKQTEISAFVNTLRGDVNDAANVKGRKEAAVTAISEEMKTEAGKIADATGTSKTDILEAMKKGINSSDIIKAIATARKVGNGFSTIIEMVLDGGWSKVNSHYGVGSGQIQADISKIIAEITNKVTPPDSSAPNQ